MIIGYFVVQYWATSIFNFSSSYRFWGHNNCKATKFRKEMSIPDQKNNLVTDSRMWK
jgi:hypothetical protein